MNVGWGVVDFKGGNVGVFPLKGEGCRYSLVRGRVRYTQRSYVSKFNTSMFLQFKVPTAQFSFGCKVPTTQIHNAKVSLSVKFLQG
jgi:hypothetical protein